MATYFEVKNNNTLKVSIDDTYRYFYEIGVLDLSNGANSPVKFGTEHGYYDETWWDRNARINYVARYKCLNSWQYVNAGSSEEYLDSIASCAKYMATVVPVNKDSVYAIRFKKASGSPKIWVRCFPTLLGAQISGNTSLYSLLVEVMASTASITPAQALQYFEIVELGNNQTVIPLCSSGLQIFDKEGKEIFNSNCKMINVRSMYSGTTGSLTITNANMVLPTTGYKNYGHDSSNYQLRYYMYRDAYWYDGANIYNSNMYLPQMRFTPYEDQGSTLFDPRESSFDTDKTVNGLVLTTLS